MTERPATSWNPVIVIYAKTGELDVAIEFFERMPGKGTVVVRTMIGAFVKYGDMGSVKLLDEMKEMNEKGLANQLMFRHGKWPYGELDFKNSGSMFAGPFVLHFSYGLLDAMFQSLCYRVIGVLANNSETFNRYSGYCAGCSEAEEVDGAMFLYSNYFTGVIALGVSKLKRLMEFRLFDSGITGLDFLDIAGNRLVGPVSNSIRNCSQLQLVELSSNTLFEVSLENLVVEFVLSLHSGYSCKRICVIGASRVNLKPYASFVHVALKASGGIPERFQKNIEAYPHRNVSTGICQCENDDWKTLQEGQWSAVISPYEKRYVVIKSKEMHYPVSVMLLVVIVLVGVAVGYWIVGRKVLSEDGSADASIAHSVKWAMHVLGEKAFAKFGKWLISLYLFDQHSASYRKILVFKFVLPVVKEMAEMTRLVTLVPFYSDLIGHSKTEAARARAAQEVYKELQNVRQEAFQRRQWYGAVWIGANYKASASVVLTLGFTGNIIFVVDIDGFLGNSKTDLSVYWYQLGAYYPIFKGYAHPDTKRREPWQFGERNIALMREAIHIRYALLPRYYTLFRKASLSGVPVMHPLWLEFPIDKETFNGVVFVVGPSILVQGFYREKQKSVVVYLPGKESWYNMRNGHAFAGESQLRTAAYETLTEVVRCSFEGAAPTEMQWVPAIMMELHKTLEAQKLSVDVREKQNEVHGLLCGCLQVIQKLGSSVLSKYIFLQNADQMIELFMREIARINATMHEEAKPDIGDFTSAAKANLFKCIHELYSFLEMGLQHFEYQVSAIIIGVVENWCRAWTIKILPSYDCTMTQLPMDLSGTKLHRLVNPLIFSCFRDIALASGEKFEKYSCYAISMLLTAAKITGKTHLQFNLED